MKLYPRTAIAGILCDISIHFLSLSTLGLRQWLIDFSGLAKVTNDIRTRELGFAGTAGYIAPEGDNWSGFDVVSFEPLLTD